MGDVNAGVRTATVAGRVLAEGATPRQVVTRLVVGGTNWRVAVVGTCLALDIPQAEAERRLDADGGDLNSEFGTDPAAGSDVEDLAEILDVLGIFDPHRDPDGDEAAIAGLLEQALSQLLPMPSGVWFGVHLAIRRSRFHQALTGLAYPHRLTSRAPDNVEYWSALVTAVDLIGATDDAAYHASVQHCRQQRDRYI